MISCGQLEVENGTITYVGSERSYEGEALDYKGDIACPGFIDIHVHGGAGVDAMDPDPEALNRLSKYLAAGGVTGFLATTHTAPLEELKAALRRVKAAQKMSAPGAQILGAHVEA